ncbi:MAG: tetratricopeptide repeat protein [Bacteroidota bacterium]
MQRLYALLIGMLLSAFLVAQPDSIPKETEEPYISEDTYVAPPDDVAQKYQQAVELMNSFQFGKAIPLFYACQRADSSNPDYASKLAYCYFQQGNYREAKRFYSSMLRQDSINTIALSYLGLIYEREQNYPVASEYYQQLLSVDSTNSYYFKQNAALAQRMGNAYHAIAYYNKAHLLNPNDISVIAELSELYFSLEAYDITASFIEKGLRLNADNFALRYINARLLNEQDDNAGVIENIEHAMALGDTVTFYQKLLGAAYIKENEFEKGRDIFARLIEKKKDGESTHYYLALAYTGLDDAEQSNVHYEKAIELGISKNTALYYRNLGSNYESQNQLRKAIKAYRSALIYSDVASIYYDLGRLSDLYYKDKKIALKYYQQFLDRSKTISDRRRQQVRDRMAALKEYQHQARGR